jgi:NAD(P)-dependent dehydrogenase (short-subunit alcohol dehydrogenase family)
MTASLEGRIALVTGGAKGIGLGIVRKLLEAGAQVAVADIDGTSFAASGLAEQADRVHFVPADATVAEDVERAVAATVERFGRLDCMVCNAGGPAGALGRILDTAPEDFDAAVALTLRSAFLGIRAAGRQMVAAGTGGRIVTIGSISAQAAGAGPPIYSTAKAALVRLTQNAAAELAPHGIQVNSISPGLILTEAMRSAGFEDSHVARFQPLAKAGLPAHVGDAVVFLAGPAADFVAGADLVVDGAALAEGIGLYARLGFNG